ncbi:ABC transporter substrate-binding protein [Bradyrhizobium sp. U87765 SZCCT0131]|uniref:ABC transporter substrate-binding protein n=1 Tax=unclassified Bradyrhizobium TaxID=2631580 RepID=UPI001BAE1276|nr:MULTISPECIES: ABC transporter substrate-binding protein [unclassified Bradyrhizobium]MBR1219777.1 ABC transporter substrate-binding protein [Bradyrhizobium sp. U87765 SZCCT0131]MBR1262428.1 ABC transporter substrate-binding protein [Bradyrhizobium sp. U87765 SZCCT0134]MBR1308389.1 ABC transporter substrate-binding protein [Bradyrhizobium sp. U87765 SZCCT0110]MBR1318210.1 ABC transporter substrate-binding protein [Bradyrhizobium sp. U87765 SZCCT0109]MBR1351913.1 ABC transporter substrate-bin
MSFRMAALAAGLLALSSQSSHAQFSDGVLRIGVLNDQSGIYADMAGPGSVVAAQIAVEEFGGKIGNVPIEIVRGDHQNKSDIGLTMARKWLDTEGVDMIADIPNSSISLAIVNLVRDKNKVAVITTSNSNRLTGDACSPNHVHWTLDNYSLAKSTGSAVLKSGAKSWFFVTADYAFGHDMEREAGDIVKKAGGTVVGSVRHPLNSSDFSSYLLQAQASKADVIALANSGSDFTNSVKQATEFGIPQGDQRLAGLAMYLTDVKSLGLNSGKGIYLSEPFYWDLNDDTRAFAKKFGERHGGAMPTSFQAGVYSGVLHYLKAVAAVGGDGDGRAIVARMKELPTQDLAFGKGSVRVDGRKMHPMYLFRVKSPEQSKGPWDLYEKVGETAAADAFKPLDPACPLVGK